MRIMTPLPHPPRSTAEQARIDATIVEIFQELISFNRVLGLEILSVRNGDVRARFAMRPELVGHYAHGRLHGGVVSAVLDAMAGMALLAAIAERHPQDGPQQLAQRFTRMGTIDLRVDFLRQGKGAHFTATAEVTRLGGRIGSAQMRLLDEAGTLIATGAASYVVA
jgi:uncharacterized protein (TIGR00369 family)